MKMPAWITAVAVVALGGLTTSFAQAQLFEALERSSPPVSAAVTADLDLDGDVDVVVHQEAFTARVAVLLNDGDGRFRAGPTISATDRPEHLAVGDLDQDGRADVVFETCSGAGATVITAFKNVGPPLAFVPGAFTLPTVALNCFARPFIADFDGDGLKDIALFSVNPAPPKFWRNVGGGVFVDASTAFAGVTSPGYVRYVADFDGDGAAEALVEPGWYASTGVLRIWDYVGTAFVETSWTVPVSTILGVGRFNADAATDVVVAQPPGSPAPSDSFYDLTTVPPTLMFSAPRPVGPWFVQGMDLDGDGLDESLQGDFVATSVFPRATGPASASIAGRDFADAHLIADLDGDGDRDVLAINGASASLRPLFNAFNVGGGLVAPYDVLPPDYWHGWLPALVDVEGDGDLDLYGQIGFSLVGSTAGAALNDGFGRFLPTMTGGGSYAPIRDAVAADLDGDGDGDLVGLWGSLPYVLWGNGAGSWTSVPLSFPAYARSMDLFDFDGDGDLDILTASDSSASGCVHVKPNLGGGVFGTAIGLGTARGANDLAYLDVEGDGDLDIAVSAGAYAGAASPTSVLLVNQGGGVYTQTTPFGTAHGDTATAADIDSDLDPDVLIGNSLFFNQGGAFPSFVSIAAPPTTGAYLPQRRRLIDLDNDGMPEILGAHYYRAGLGGGVFGPDVLLPADVVANYGPFPQVGDVDRDGDLDLVSNRGATLWNKTAHLARGSIARLGRVATLEIYGPPAEPYLLFASTNALATPFSLPSWGYVFINPAQVFNIVPGTLNASGAATLGAPAPNLPALAGLSVWWQAAFLSQTKLTNAEETKILAY
jgi:hypothetical protein